MLDKTVVEVVSETREQGPIPSTHASHSGWAIAVPAFFAYLPAGHLVWAVHHSKGQSVATK